MTMAAMTVVVVMILEGVTSNISVSAWDGSFLLAWSWDGMGFGRAFLLEAFLLRITHLVPLG